MSWLALFKADFKFFSCLCRVSLGTPVFSNSTKTFIFMSIGESKIFLGVSVRVKGADVCLAMNWQPVLSLPFLFGTKQVCKWMDGWVNSNEMIRFTVVPLDLQICADICGVWTMIS